MPIAALCMLSARWHGRRCALTVSCAVLLNDTALYDLLLADELMDNFLGAMECTFAAASTRAS